jgi:hypothetical protein
LEARYSRRSVIGAALVAVLGGLAGLAGPGLAKSKPRKLRVWRLDPNKGRGCKRGDRSPGCTGCHACHHHAKNKRFATEKAANKHRAHRHCKCKVVEGGKITRSSYVKLFGEPGDLKHQSIDLRHDKQAQIFNAGWHAARG